MVEPVGAESNLLFTLDVPPVATDEVKAAIGGESGADAGRLLPDAGRRSRLTATIHDPPPAGPGGEIEMAIDPSKLHLLDVESGLALDRRASGDDVALSSSTREA